MPLLTPHVPNGLIELMKDLAKEVLRDKPENIYEFAAVHFEKLIQQRDGSMHKGYEQFVAYEAQFNGQQRYAVPADCGYSCQRPTPMHPNLQPRKSKSDMMASFKAMESINEETESIYNDEKYLKAIYVIQRYYRRYAERKKEAAFNNGLSAATAAIIIQRTMRKLFANKYKLKVPAEGDTNPIKRDIQEDMDNVSEAASYTSSSTIQMLADSQDGRENRLAGREEVADGSADVGSTEFKVQKTQVEPLAAVEQRREEVSGGGADVGPTEFKEQKTQVEPLVAVEQSPAVVEDKKSIADENGNTESIDQDVTLSDVTAPLDDTSTAHIGILSTKIGSNDQQNSLHTNTVEIDSNTSSDPTQIQKHITDVKEVADFPLNFPQSLGATPDTFPATSPQPATIEEEPFAVRLGSSVNIDNNAAYPYQNDVQVRKFIPVTRESLKLYDVFYQDRDDADYSDSLNESIMERDSLENEDLDVDSLESIDNVTQIVKREVRDDDGSLYGDTDDVQQGEDVQKSMELERTPSYLYGIHPPRTPVVERKNIKNKHSAGSIKAHEARDIDLTKDLGDEKFEEASLDSKASTSEESNATEIENVLEQDIRDDFKDYEVNEGHEIEEEPTESELLKEQQVKESADAGIDSKLTLDITEFIERESAATYQALGRPRSIDPHKDQKDHTKLSASRRGSTEKALADTQLKEEVKESHEVHDSEHGVNKGDKESENTNDKKQDPRLQELKIEDKSKPGNPLGTSQTDSTEEDPDIDPKLSEIKTSYDISKTSTHRKKRSVNVVPPFSANENIQQETTDLSHNVDINGNSASTTADNSEISIDKGNISQDKLELDPGESNLESKASSVTSRNLEPKIELSISKETEADPNEYSNTLLIDALIPRTSSSLGYFESLYSGHNLSRPTSSLKENHDSEVELQLRELQNLNNLYPGLEIRDIISEYHTKDIQPDERRPSTGLEHDANNNVEGFEMSHKAEQSPEELDSINIEELKAVDSKDDSAKDTPSKEAKEELEKSKEIHESSKKSFKSLEFAGENSQEVAVRAVDTPALKDLSVDTKIAMSDAEPSPKAESKLVQNYESNVKVLVPPLNLGDLDVYLDEERSDVETPKSVEEINKSDKVEDDGASTSGLQNIAKSKGKEVDKDTKDENTTSKLPNDSLEGIVKDDKELLSKNQVEESSIAKESTASAVKSEQDGDHETVEKSEVLISPIRNLPESHNKLKEEDYFGNTIDNNEPDVSAGIDIIKMESLGRSMSINRLNSKEKLPSVEEEIDEEEDTKPSTQDLKKDISNTLPPESNSAQKTSYKNESENDRKMYRADNAKNENESNDKLMSKMAEVRAQSMIENEKEDVNPTDKSEEDDENHLSKVIEGVSLTDALKNYKGTDSAETKGDVIGEEAANKSNDSTEGLRNEKVPATDSVKGRDEAGETSNDSSKGLVVEKVAVKSSEKGRGDVIEAEVIKTVNGDTEGFISEKVPVKDSVREREKAGDDNTEDLMIEKIAVIRSNERRGDVIEAQHSASDSLTIKQENVDLSDLDKDKNNPNFESNTKANTLTQQNACSDRELVQKPNSSSGYYVSDGNSFVQDEISHEEKPSSSEIDSSKELELMHDNLRELATTMDLEAFGNLKVRENEPIEVIIIKPEQVNEKSTFKPTSAKEGSNSDYLQGKVPKSASKEDSIESEQSPDTLVVNPGRSDVQQPDLEVEVLKENLTHLHTEAEKTIDIIETREQYTEPSSSSGDEKLQSQVKITEEIITTNEPISDQAGEEESKIGTLGIGTVMKELEALGTVLSSDHDVIDQSTGALEVKVSEINLIGGQPESEVVYKEAHVYPTETVKSGLKRNDSYLEATKEEVMTNHAADHESGAEVPENNLKEEPGLSEKHDLAKKSILEEGNTVTDSSLIKDKPDLEIPKDPEPDKTDLLVSDELVKSKAFREVAGDNSEPEHKIEHGPTSLTKVVDGSSQLDSIASSVSMPTEVTSYDESIADTSADFSSIGKDLDFFEDTITYLKNATTLLGTMDDVFDENTRKEGPPTVVVHLAEDLPDEDEENNDHKEDGDQKKDQPKSEDVLQQAAIVIQSAVRGYQARKALNKNSNQPERSDDAIKRAKRFLGSETSTQGDAIRQAAIVIQIALRGYRVRRALNERKRSHPASSLKQEDTEEFKTPDDKPEISQTPIAIIHPIKHSPHSTVVVHPAADFSEGVEAEVGKPSPDLKDEKLKKNTKETNAEIVQHVIRPSTLPGRIRREKPLERRRQSIKDESLTQTTDDGLPLIRPPRAQEKHSGKKANIVKSMSLDDTQQAVKAKTVKSDSLNEMRKSKPVKSDSSNKVIQEKPIEIRTANDGLDKRQKDPTKLHSPEKKTQIVKPLEGQSQTETHKTKTFPSKTPSTSDLQQRPRLTKSRRNTFSRSMSVNGNTQKENVFDVEAIKKELLSKKVKTPQKSGRKTKILAKENRNIRARGESGKKSTKIGAADDKNSQRIESAKTQMTNSDSDSIDSRKSEISLDTLERNQDSVKSPTKTSKEDDANSEEVNSSDRPDSSTKTQFTALDQGKKDGTGSDSAKSATSSESPNFSGTNKIPDSSKKTTNDILTDDFKEKVNIDQMEPFVNAKASPNEVEDMKGAETSNVFEGTHPGSVTSTSSGIFDNLKKEVDKMKETALGKSATLIQKTFRGYRTRKSLPKSERKLSKEVNEQASGMTDQGSDILINDSILKEKMTEAVNTQGEKDDTTMTLDSLKEDLNNLEKSATKIQKTFRGYKARRDLKNSDQISENKAIESGLKLKGKADPENKRQIEDQNDIQTNKQKTTEENKPVQEPTSIFDSLEKDVNQLKEDSATKIQKTFRGYKTRKDLKKSEQTSEHSHGDSKVTDNTKSTTKDGALDTTGETKDITVVREPTSIFDDLNEDIDDFKHSVLDKSATKIQKTFRGYKARKDLDGKIKVVDRSLTGRAPLRGNKSTNDDKEDTDEGKGKIHQKDGVFDSFDVEEFQNAALANSATTIQKTFRGYKTRKDLINKRLNEGKFEKSEGKSDNYLEKEAKITQEPEMMDKEPKYKPIDEARRKDVSEADLVPHKEDTDILDKAAVMIQKTYKGFRSRKESLLGGKRHQPEHIEEDLDNHQDPDKHVEQMAHNEGKNYADADDSPIKVTDSPLVIETAVKDSSSDETKNDTEPSDAGPSDSHSVVKTTIKATSAGALLEEAASTIQKAYRDYHTRKDGSPFESPIKSYSHGAQRDNAFKEAIENSDESSTFIGPDTSFDLSDVESEKHILNPDRRSSTETPTLIHDEEVLIELDLDAAPTFAISLHSGGHQENDSGPNMTDGNSLFVPQGIRRKRSIMDATAPPLEDILNAGDNDPKPQWYVGDDLIIPTEDTNLSSQPSSFPKPLASSSSLEKLSSIDARNENLNLNPNLQLTPSINSAVVSTSSLLFPNDTEMHDPLNKTSRAVSANKEEEIRLDGTKNKEEEVEEDFQDEAKQIEGKAEDQNLDKDDKEDMSNRLAARKETSYLYSIDPFAPRSPRNLENEPDDSQAIVPDLCRDCVDGAHQGDETSSTADGHESLEARMSKEFSLEDASVEATKDAVYSTDEIKQFVLMEESSSHPVVNDKESVKVNETNGNNDIVVTEMSNLKGTDKLEKIIDTQVSDISNGVAVKILDEDNREIHHQEYPSISLIPPSSEEDISDRDSICETTQRAGGGIAKPVEVETSRVTDEDLKSLPTEPLNEHKGDQTPEAKEETNSPINTEDNKVHEGLAEEKVEETIATLSGDKKSSLKSGPNKVGAVEDESKATPLDEEVQEEIVIKSDIGGALDSSRAEDDAVKRKTEEETIGKDQKFEDSFSGDTIEKISPVVEEIIKPHEQRQLSMHQGTKSTDQDSLKIGNDPETNKSNLEAESELKSDDSIAKDEPQGTSEESVSKETTEEGDEKKSTEPISKSDVKEEKPLDDNAKSVERSLGLIKGETFDEIETISKNVKLEGLSDTQVEEEPKATKGETDMNSNNIELKTSSEDHDQDQTKSMKDEVIDKIEKAGNTLEPKSLSEDIAKELTSSVDRKKSEPKSLSEDVAEELTSSVDKEQVSKPKSLSEDIAEELTSSVGKKQVSEPKSLTEDVAEELISSVDKEQVSKPKSVSEDRAEELTSPVDKEQVSKPKSLSDDIAEELTSSVDKEQVNKPKSLSEDKAEELTSSIDKEQVNKPKSLSDDIAEELTSSVGKEQVSEPKSLTEDVAEELISSVDKEQDNKPKFVSEDKPEVLTSSVDKEQVSEPKSLTEDRAEELTSSVDKEQGSEPKVLSEDVAKELTSSADKKEVNEPKSLSEDIAEELTSSMNKEQVIEAKSLSEDIAEELTSSMNKEQISKDVAKNLALSGDKGNINVEQKEVAIENKSKDSSHTAAQVQEEIRKDIDQKISKATDENAAVAATTVKQESQEASSKTEQQEAESISLYDKTKDPPISKEIPSQEDLEIASKPLHGSLKAEDIVTTQPSVKIKTNDSVDTKSSTEPKDKSKSLDGISLEPHEILDVEANLERLMEELPVGNKANTIEPHDLPTENAPEEVIEVTCVKKTVPPTPLSATSDQEESELESTTTKADSTTTTPGYDDASENDAAEIPPLMPDNLEAMTAKLRETEAMVARMQQRRASEHKVSIDSVEQPAAFDEPICEPIKPMQELQKSSSIDTEDDIILQKLQRSDTTRESSAQSESVIYGDATSQLTESDDTFNENMDFNTLHRMNTIAADRSMYKPQGHLFKSVTIDDTIKYIDPVKSTEESGGSFSMDDAISADVRKKILAYSVSEADSDYYEAGDQTSRPHDDFNISTALDTFPSSDTDTTIISAATKIQAGARGFLTRRRLRRASMGTKSSLTEEIKTSFGNDAIGESLDRLVEEEATKRMPKVQYHRQVGVSSLPSALGNSDEQETTTVHLSPTREDDESDNIKLAQLTATTTTNQPHGEWSSIDGKLHKLSTASENDVNRHGTEEEDDSEQVPSNLEATLAARRLTLQRGDAMRNDSAPDDENNGNAKQVDSVKNIPPASGGMLFHQKTMVESTTTTTTTKTTTERRNYSDAAATIKKEKVKWFAMRQNSMPVQIDSEVFRVLPKHMRKRIKSAEGETKKRIRLPRD